MRLLHALFIIGAGVLYFCVVFRYPLLDTGTYLIGLLIICLCAGGVLFGAEGDDPVTPKYVAMSLLPLALAALFVVNGALDRSTEIRHETVVVDSHYGRSWTRIVVRSWRPGQSTLDLYMSTWTPFFVQDEPLTVGTKPGMLKIEWISSVTRQ